MNLYNSRLEYSEKIIEKLSQRINFLNKRSNRFSLYRFIVFISGVALTVAGFLTSGPAGWIALFISLAAFSITVHSHNMLLTGIKRFYNYLNIKKQHLSRMKIDWENIPEPVLENPPEDLTTGKDLDLFGKRSLHHLIDVSVSFEGSAMLKNFLTDFKPDRKTILFRQNIIRELSSQTLFRDKFLLKAKMVSKKQLHCEKILNWLKNDTDEVIPAYLFPVSLILIFIYLTLFILSNFEITGSSWFAVFLIYFFLYSSFQKKAGKISEEAAELDNQIKKFSALIFFTGNHNLNDSPGYSDFISNSFFKENNAIEKLKSLRKITSALALRENPILRLIVNIFFPYDIYFCGKMNKLKSELKENIPVWLDKLNELECYISIANFSFLNPDYNFPEICEDEKGKFESAKLGHPLIKREVKICNDFSMNKENEILIITGSNMSGKSTFLKSIGVNMCLANTGAPVNADHLKLSLFELFTCIKVNDSVSDGISYFYAEVKRLRELLDEFGNERHLPVFFLIDEIFKGTNNKERLQGSRAYIKRLSELNGCGAVTTHDLELVYLADEINKITNYHFREEIENDKMVFDYLLHKGPCPTTNALRIMELSGLPVK